MYISSTHTIKIVLSLSSRTYYKAVLCSLLKNNNIAYRLGYLIYMV